MKKFPHNSSSGTSGRPSGRPGVLRSWGLLLAWIVGIWCFVFLLAPLARHFQPVRTLTDFIRANDIDAGAYYYTEVEEFAVAEHAIRDTMTHANTE
jgi:hypothetical protein